MQIAIIGAGIAGLATAVRLAAKGHQVVVYEANAFPGGKLSEIKGKGFRFDAGPSLFTMPMYVEDLQELARPHQVPDFEYEQLDIVCNYFWEDGTRLSAYAEVAAFEREVQEKLGLKPGILRKALDKSRTKYELVGRIFMEKPLHRWQTWLDMDVLKAMLQIHKLDIFSTMHRANRRMARHPKLVQLFDRYATYNGSNPYKAPGILNLIPHLEQHIGAYFPKKGMVSIANHLVSLAKEKGVQFHFEEPVHRILVKTGKAVGLETGKGQQFFDRVVCNMDVFFAYRKLLPDQPQPERILKQEKSSSALIFYWGIKGNFQELHHHNIFFSDDYQAEFEHIAQGTVYQDPTVYINITSKHKPDDAPPGCENWFTMVNVPCDRGQDWDRLIPEIRQQILDKLSRILKTDSAARICFEDHLEPRTIESRTQSHLGALYGTSSNNRSAAFMRHPNFTHRIPHLYFCGGSVHPGGGIPLCLLSAKIIDEHFE
ncbi:MAG: phytoene desaturase [Phaeodactylibacter sp.]|nr:phytoene desaturase [Phaeodactylibacter sp.]